MQLRISDRMFPIQMVSCLWLLFIFLYADISLYLYIF